VLDEVPYELHQVDREDHSGTHPQQDQVNLYESFQGSSSQRCSSGDTNNRTSRHRRVVKRFNGYSRRALGLFCPLRNTVDHFGAEWNKLNSVHHERVGWWIGTREGIQNGI
jgi:hypothetical protein